MLQLLAALSVLALSGCGLARNIEYSRDDVAESTLREASTGRLCAAYAHRGTTALAREMRRRGAECDPVAAQCAAAGAPRGSPDFTACYLAQRQINAAQSAADQDRYLRMIDQGNRMMQGAPQTNCYTTLNGLGGWVTTCR